MNTQFQQTDNMTINDLEVTFPDYVPDESIPERRLTKADCTSIYACKQYCKQEGLEYVEKHRGYGVAVYGREQNTWTRNREIRLGGFRHGE